MTKRRTTGWASTLGLLGALFCCSIGCSDDADEDSGEQSEAARACSAMCDTYMDALDACGEGRDRDSCETECGEHLDEGESTIDEVNCGAEAADCTTWEACGDLL